jgi:hypothetical protein
VGATGRKKRPPGEDAGSGLSSVVKVTRSYESSKAKIDQTPHKSENTKNTKKHKKISGPARSRTVAPTRALLQYLSELSPVLQVIGVAPEIGMGAIRLSLGRNTTQADVLEGHVRSAVQILGPLANDKTQRHSSIDNGSHGEEGAVKTYPQEPAETPPARPPEWALSGDLRDSWRYCPKPAALRVLSGSTRGRGSNLDSQRYRDRFATGPSGV